MISGQELLDRKLYYRSAYKELTIIHGKPPTHEEMIMYMALILKEDPIELALAILKLKQGEAQNERAENINFDLRAMEQIQGQVLPGRARQEDIF